MVIAKKIVKIGQQKSKIFQKQQWHSFFGRHCIYGYMHLHKAIQQK